MAIGTAVLVGGKVVAWFAEFDEEARDWCSSNHFGRWLAWRAQEPEIVPMTAEELEECDKRAEEMMAKLRIE